MEVDLTAGRCWEQVIILTTGIYYYNFLIENPHLQYHVDQYGDEGKGQVEYEPDLYRLDIRGAG